MTSARLPPLVVVRYPFIQVLGSPTGAGGVKFALESTADTIVRISCAILANITYCAFGLFGQSATAFHSCVTSGSFHISQYLILPAPTWLSSAVTKSLKCWSLPVPSQFRSSGGSQIPGPFCDWKPQVVFGGPPQPG